MTIQVIASILLLLHLTAVVFSASAISLVWSMSRYPSALGAVSLMSNVVPIVTCLYYIQHGNYVDWGVLTWYAIYNSIFTFALTFLLWNAYKIAKRESDKKGGYHEDKTI